MRVAARREKRVAGLEQTPEPQRVARLNVGGSFRAHDSFDRRGRNVPAGKSRWFADTALSIGRAVVSLPARRWRTAVLALLLVRDANYRWPNRSPRRRTAPARATPRRPPRAFGRSRSARC